MNTTDKYNSVKSYDYMFKILFIMYWSIFWFIGVILTDNKFDSLATSICWSYIILCTTYLLIYLINIKCNKIYESKIEIYYKMFTIITFVVSSYSYYIMPISIFWFLFKLILVCVYMYISIVKVSKYKLEEGVVGIMNASLMLFMLLRY